MKVKLGKITITTEDQSAELNALREHVAQELEKIHTAKDGAESVEVSKNLVPTFDLPYTSFYRFSADSKRKEEVDLKVLRFWANELPNAPQAIEYIINSMFAHGHKFVKREGAEDKPELLSRIKMFFEEQANENGTSAIEIIKTAIRNTCQVGDGFIEKVYEEKGTILSELYSVDPVNMVVLKDDEEAKKGLFVLTGYAKVSNDFKEGEDIEDESKLEKKEVVHIKYADEGDAYGHSPFEKNQEMTKFIINVLNLNQKKFTNEIRHSLHVHLGKDATWADANIFLNQYKTNYLGKFNYGKPLITVGDMKVEKWDLPDKDFDYQSFMEKIGMHHAASLLNVSPSEIVNNDSKYSNASQGHRSTILNCIYPWQAKVEGIVNNHIMRALEGIEDSKESELTYRFSLGRENLLTMYENLAGINGAVVSGYMTPNQAKRIVDPVNMPEVNDDWANQHYMRVGNEVRVLDEEFFGGTDEETAKSFEDDGEKLSTMEGFFKKK